MSSVGNESQKKEGGKTERDVVSREGEGGGGGGVCVCVCVRLLRERRRRNTARSKKDGWLREHNSLSLKKQNNAVAVK